MTATRTDRTRTRGWMALSLALFLVTVGLTGVSAALGSALSREHGDHADVRSVSEKFATALLSYDYRNLDAAKRTVLGLVTPQLQARYEKDFTTLTRALTQSQARAAAQVARVYLGPVSKTAARTIVVTNAASVTATGMRGSLETYLELTLQKTGRRWLVDQVVTVKTGEPATVTTDTPATTTSAPKH